jgi:hypothetical protein
MSPNGAHAVSGDTTGSVWVWDAATGAPVRRLSDGLGVIRQVAISSDGARVAAAGDQGTWVWDAETGVELLAMDDPSRVVAFDPSGERLLLTHADTEARVVDAASGQPLGILSGHSATVMDGRFDDSGSHVVTAGADGTARVWDAATGTSSIELRAPAEAGGTDSADLSPDGTRVVTGQDDGSVIVWDASSGEPLVTFRADTSQVLAVRFGPDGSRIVTAGTDDAVARVFDCSLCGSTDQVMALARDRVTRALTPDERTRFLHEPSVTHPASPSPEPPVGMTDSATPSATPDSAMGPSAQPTLVPGPMPSAEPTDEPVVDPLGQPLCAGRRESCALRAGRYHVPLFHPPLSFEVGDGWSNDYVTPRTIVVSRADGSASLTVYGAPTDGLLVGRVVPLAPGPDGLLAHLRRWYGLSLSEPVPVDIDGHAGIAFDVDNRLDRELEVLQQDEGTEFISAGGSARWVALDVEGTTVLLTVAVPGDGTLGSAIADVQEVIDSIRFDPT